MAKAKQTGTPINPKIGERIHTQRRRLDMTQKDVAHRAGISTTVLSLLENGEQSVSVERLAVIAKVLGLSLDYLCPQEEVGEHEEQERALEAAGAA
jgi:transcriptional regulator with XRE-family HTH domain